MNLNAKPENGIWSTTGEGLFANNSLSSTIIYGMKTGVNTLMWKAYNYNCKDSSYLTIDYKPITANAGTDSIVCLNFTKLKAEGNGIWTTTSVGRGVFANEHQANTSVTGLGKGENKFVWTAINELGCVASDTVIISTPKDSVIKVPVIIGKTNTLEDSKLTYTTNISYADYYFWTVGDSSYSGKSMKSVIYQWGSASEYLDSIPITLKINLNYCGMIEADTFMVKVQKFEAGTPNQNLFSPNGDGFNDMFIISELKECADCFPNNELYIFNRWGSMVYKATPYKNDWDGRSNGNSMPDKQVLPNGTYYYIFKLNKYDVKPKTGYIELRK